MNDDNTSTMFRRLLVAQSARTVANARVQKAKSDLAVADVRLTQAVQDFQDAEVQSGRRYPAREDNRIFGGKG